jgi:hypothetical protein
MEKEPEEPLIPYPDQFDEKTKEIFAPEFDEIFENIARNKFGIRVK